MSGQGIRGNLVSALSPRSLFTYARHARQGGGAGAGADLGGGLQRGLQRRRQVRSRTMNLCAFAHSGATPSVTYAPSKRTFRERPRNSKPSVFVLGVRLRKQETKSNCPRALIHESTATSTAALWTLHTHRGESIVRLALAYFSSASVSLRAPRISLLCGKQCSWLAHHPCSGLLPAPLPMACLRPGRCIGLYMDVLMT